MKIKSLTEAYSMQPLSYKVCDKQYDNRIKETKHVHTADCITFIETEMVHFGEGAKKVYQCFTIGNKLKHQLMADSFNVEYFTNP